MKIWMGILTVAAALTLSGCFELPSVCPLYTDQTAVAEPRLVSAWQTKDGKEQMFVRTVGDREYRLTYVADKGDVSVWEVHVVRLGETLVADLRAANEDATIPAHHFVALSLENNVLWAWFLDSEKLREQAVQKGLAYAVGEKNEVALTAPTAALCAFLQQNLAKEMTPTAGVAFLPLK